MPTVKLVSITAYSQKWGIDRSTCYELINKGLLTRYEDDKGTPMLNENEKPKVQKYGERKRKIS